MTRTAIALSALPILAGCAALPSKPVFLTGLWGGSGVEMLIEGGLAHLKFDCAAGTIDSNIAATGPFSAPGSYRPGQTGEVRVGQIFISKRAVYSGTIDKDQMTLAIDVEDDSPVGPFTLTRGVPGQLNRCPKSGS